MQNAGLSVIPLIIATIYTQSDDKYIPNVELFFVALGICGLFVGLWLNYDDYKHNWILNSPLSKSAETGVEGYEPLLVSEEHGTGKTDEVTSIIFDSGARSGSRADSVSLSATRLKSADNLNKSSLKL